MANFKPRPNQAKILKYQGGRMGVSAVPGSGKTFTLSMLAAQIICDGLVQDEQEVLVVTLVNSAVENFNSRIGKFIQEKGLLPNIGYRVRTLHGLAHDIVRERPDLAGLSDRFQIIDEKESDEILKNAVTHWVHTHPEFFLEYTREDIDLTNNRKVLQAWYDWSVDIAGSFIHQAKDLQLSPLEVQELVNPISKAPLLYQMGSEIYVTYQRALSYRNGIDFDDLIRLALRVLQSDPGYLARLKRRWPYILEDEAQDSNLLQEAILRLLVGEKGNWVRVGDPNQAIYETFTTASPEFLKRFIREPGVIHYDLPNSGRSTLSIMRLANHLIQWSNQIDLPNPELKGALSRPLIDPTPRGDPQPNPPDSLSQIFLQEKGFTPDDEIQAVVRSLINWLPENKGSTVAVLVPRNERGAKVVEALKNAGIEAIELMRSSLSTRQTSDLLASILQSLADPGSTSKAAQIYRAMRISHEKDETKRDLYLKVVPLIQKCPYLETYLGPRPGQDWLNELQENHTDEEIISELEWFRHYLTRWQAAVLLPVDQLILTVAQDLFAKPHELALAHKLALMMERTAQLHPDWSLHNFIEELEAIASNRRKLSGFTSEDLGFDPESYRGKVVVATIHKAKGLEWDRVYILSANNYDFPMALPGDSIIAEKWFVRNQANLQAIALAQLKALAKQDLIGLYDEQTPVEEARRDYAAERIRLFFVGVTRAKKELIITWNSGQRGDARPAQTLLALQAYWKGNVHEA